LPFLGASEGIVVLTPDVLLKSNIFLVAFQFQFPWMLKDEGIGALLQFMCLILQICALSFGISLVSCFLYNNRRELEYQNKLN